MRSRCSGSIPVLLTLLTVFLVAPGTPAAGPAADDEQVLQSAGLPTDNRALLEFFRLRAHTETDHERLTSLVRQLGSPTTEAKAAGELIAWGPAAVAPLRHAVNDLDNPATARRARKCLQAIEGPHGAALVAASARLLAERAPDGTAEVLLTYLPYADDAVVTEAVSSSLAAVAFPGGKPHPALLRALEDAVPARRAVALEVLCRADRPELFPAVRKLLADPKPAVRSRAALALARQQDADSFPVLIDLIGVLPAEQRRPIEETLQDLAGEWAPGLPRGGDDALTGRIRREVWAAWWRSTDGPTLLEEFRKRTLTPETATRAHDLVRRLGDSSFTERERASDDLAALGRLVLPVLREAAKDRDAEVARRVEAVRDRVEKGPNDALPVTAARLLALRKPAGAAEVLLAFLPSAEGEDVAAEVLTALAAVAVRDGRPEPALLKALADDSPRLRAAAAEALCRAGGAESLAAVRKLLQDGDLSVRLRAAVGLAGAADKDAVPVLIDLVAALPREQSWQAQELLARLAGEGAPETVGGDDEAARKKARDAWAVWWKANAAKADLSRLATAQVTLGYTTVVLVNDGGLGRVVELGRDGKVRWQIDGLQYPVDAWVLPGNRVLVGEYNGMKVTERDLTGRVVWEKSNLGGRVVNVQRLPSGNTFIAVQNALLEVDRAGKEVFAHRRPANDVWAAYRSADGGITFFTNGQQCVRLDRSGKEVKTFPLGAGGSWTSGIDVTPQGRILASNHNANKVEEYNADGKKVWEAPAAAITTATRAANGNTIVSSYFSNRVFEIDRNGKVVWEHKDTLHPFRARRR
ncbi:MAG TPA: HEAT repeat domain-containing protein [Gemmataceae bacterium]|nr:HEAT repeat domain-containing protein [Gemmataceae bacterium]